jgi:hypothetical protein
MSVAQKYRMYIDETGNPSMKSMSESNRYLSLTGVVLNLNHESQDVSAGLTGFKQRYFDYDPDDPVILHRSEIHSCHGAFACLKSPAAMTSFNQDLLGLLRDWDYTVITAVIDKQAHKAQYGQWANEPYGYCMEVLTEKYVLWLKGHDRTGDVLAEARGGNEDAALKKAYSDWYASGTNYASADLYHQRLTSCELKLKQKGANIPGLQIADLVSQPSFRYGLWTRTHTPVPAGYERDTVDLLCNSKYNRRSDGAILGYGLKWLPK